MEKHFPASAYPLHLTINPIVDRSVATVLREGKQFSIRAALSPSAQGRSPDINDCWSWGDLLGN